MFSCNMPFNLLRPNKTLAAYATFILEFFCVTAYVRLQILFDFGAEIVKLLKSFEKKPIHT